MEKKVVVITKEIYDFVESHKSNEEGGISYWKDFHVNIGDEYVLNGVGAESDLVFLEKGKQAFSIPAGVVGVDIDAIRKEMKKEAKARRIRETLVEQTKKTDWVAVQNDIALELAKIEFSDRGNEWIKEDKDRINRIVARAKLMTVNLMSVEGDE